MKRSDIIGFKLKELREQYDLKQKEISEKLNIAQTTYAGYETGKHEPNIETLIGLANIFRTSIDYIVGRYNEPLNIEQENMLNKGEVSAKRKRSKAAGSPCKPSDASARAK